MFKAKFKTSLLHIIIIIVTSILLIGCGGGGSADNNQRNITTSSSSNSYSYNSQISNSTITELENTQSSNNTKVLSVNTTVDNANNTSIINTPVVGTLTPKNALKITEVSLENNVNPWFEIYNPNNEIVNLRSHKLRSLTNNINGLPYVFELPDMDIPANAYVVIAAKNSGMLDTGANVVLLKNNQTIPNWLGNGFIELLYQDKTVDMININKIHEALTSQENKKIIYTKNLSAHKESIALWQNNTWMAMNFATPAGQNDIPPDELDNDQDGIPSIAKQQGNTFGGIDIYAMGARQGQKDIFIQLDYMKDIVSIPQRKALDKIKQAFSKKNIALHIDVGNLFNTQFSPNDYNLGQGKWFANANCVTLPSIYAEKSICKTIFDYKKYMLGMRRHFFNYVFFATSQVETGVGPSGMAEYLGKNSLITLYGWNLNMNSELNANLLTNYQAGAMMHELGHNFGLLHGGGDNITYKPNYVSVMNYLYQLRGVNLDLNTKISIDRFLNWRGYINMDLCVLNNSPCNADFVVDYSNGLAAPINENRILESQLLTGLISYENNTYLDFNRDMTQNAEAYALDLNQDNKKDVLEDFNDWANLKFNTKTIDASQSPYIGLILESGVYHTMN
jgi:hypothetical protein